MAQRGTYLGRQRASGKGGEVQLIQNLGVTLFGGQQLAEAVLWIADFFVDGRAVDELERLGQVAIAFALAFAGQFAGGLAEGFEERVIHFAIGELNSARSHRQAGELLGHGGHVAQCIEQLLGRQ